MRLPIQVIIILFALAAAMFIVAPGTVLTVLFLVVMWALWRRARRSGVRR